MSDQQYQKCIDACIECATSCNHCAVSCLEEKEVQYLTKCIRLNLECAVICRATVELMNINGRYSKEVCRLCATICEACAQLCEQHASMGMEHCRECAEVCRACAKETMEVYQNLETKDADQQAIHQDECAIISRAAAELISLSSAYTKEIAQLNVTICDASVKDFEQHANMGMEHRNKFALAAMKAHEDLVDEGKETITEQVEVHKKKKKHSSALLAASMWRSPTGHSLQHVNRDVRGSSDLTNTGPFVNYD